MEPPRPTRWQRRRAHRDSQARRLLAVGAAVGVVVGLASLPLVGVPHGETAWLVRASMLLPALIYVGWWLIDPSVARTDATITGHPTIDPQARLERIESTFDEAAVPRARRERPAVQEDSPARREFRSSIRRDAAPPVDSSAFGVSRPAQPTQGTGSD